MLLQTIFLFLALGVEIHALNETTYFGKFELTEHHVQGRVYGLEDKIIRIERFYYDGEGPKGGRGLTFFGIKPEYVYKEYGAYGEPLMIIELDEFNFEVAIYNKNLTLKLERSIDEYDRIVVWCQDYEVSFGHVDLSKARMDDVDEPLPLKYVGSFVESSHNISGKVYRQDDNSFIIQDFNYDGKGRSVIFFGGTDVNFKSGQPIEYPYKPYRSILGPKALARIDYRDIELRLPSNLKASDLLWLSVWNIEENKSLGQALLNGNIKQPKN